ncbi:FadR/GntR family transcriptional regulator [Roseicitreum antarcticum]|uniref:DNA-binding transcriptional regulator, FadR family n=1 Tax=Roseicitreum antarcticum TaxID=564137 RepID=A0A1H2VEK7_9RHOB|nr:FadR/GntR family transcriptional regulator [Roseicitreum antarcticum]SDW66767.1 DNA-binding transcriptional regulator, FadR family [Roseicitreum antarcticum]
MMSPPPAKARPRTLVSQVSEALRKEIESGTFQPGERLPSEAALTQVHLVSRTVIREAIAILRSDGLVETRKGAGVFALDPAARRRGEPFSELNTGRISEAIELLEMRSAFEIRSANLAAVRRSNAQLDAILRNHEVIGDCIAKGEPTREADFQFHFAIAEATQNTRFPQFLTLIRDGIMPRAELTQTAGQQKAIPNPYLQQEHGAIVGAIMDGDGAGAEHAMKTHLDGTLRRYREILRASLGE